MCSQNFFTVRSQLLFSVFPKAMGGTETGTCTPELSLRRLRKRWLISIFLALRLVTRVLAGTFTFLGRFVI